MKNVVIIGSRNSGQKNDPLVLAEALSKKHATTVVYWEDLVFTIATGAVSVRVNEEPVFDTTDLVIALGWYKNGAQSIYRDVAFSLALYLHDKGIEFWNSEMLKQRSASKLSCTVQLALAGLSVPSTRFCLTFNTIMSSQPLPCVLKAASASRGRNNYLIVNEEDRARHSVHAGAYLVQEYLQNDHDLRVICFGGKPRLVLRRSRIDDSTHLNNTSQGGTAEWQEIESLPAGLLTEAEKICIIMGRELAGIDFIPDASARSGYACLEVNAIPQLTSGYDVSAKMIELANSI